MSGYSTLNNSILDIFLKIECFLANVGRFSIYIDILIRDLSFRTKYIHVCMSSIAHRYTSYWKHVLYEVSFFHMKELVNISISLRFLCFVQFFFTISTYLVICSPFFLTSHENINISLSSYIHTLTYIIILFTSRREIYS